MAKKKKTKKAIKRLAEFSSFLYDELQVTRTQLRELEQEVAKSRPRDLLYSITNKGF